MNKHSSPGYPIRLEYVLPQRLCGGEHSLRDFWRQKKIRKKVNVGIEARIRYHKVAKIIMNSELREAILPGGPGRAPLIHSLSYTAHDRICSCPARLCARYIETLGPEPPPSN